MPDLIQFEPEVSIDFKPEERTRDEKKAGYAQQKRELEEAARQGKGIENLISLAQIGLKTIAPLDVTGTATREMVRQGEQPLPPVIPPQAFQNDVNTVVGFGAQGLRNLGIPIPTDIQQGISEFGAETLSSMTDPTAGAAMIAGGMAPKIAGPAIGRYFQAKMASEIPAATEAAMQTETPSEQVKAGLGVASLAALPIAIQAHLNRANAIQIPPGIPSMGSTLEMPRGARAPRVEPVPIERLTGADLVRMNEQMNRESGIDFEPEKVVQREGSILPDYDPMDVGLRQRVQEKVVQGKSRDEAIAEVSNEGKSVSDVIDALPRGTRVRAKDGRLFENDTIGDIADWIEVNENTGDLMINSVSTSQNLRGGKIERLGKTTKTTEKGVSDAQSLRASEGQLPETRVEPQGIQEAGGNVVEQKPPVQPEPVVQGGQPQAQGEVLLTPEVAPAEPISLPAKPLSDWVVEALAREGKKPDRIFNDVDLGNPSIIEAIKADPSLTDAQKQHLLKTGSLIPPTAKPSPLISENQPRIQVSDLSKQKATGGYSPFTGGVFLDKEAVKKMAPEERAAVVRHELAHKIETETELWQQSDDFLWRLWEQDRNHPIWDFSGEVTGRVGMRNDVSPEIIAELYASHYPKGTFTVKERPVVYEWEGENWQGPKEYPIPPELMAVLDQIEAKLGIWKKKASRGTSEAKPSLSDQGTAPQAAAPSAASGEIGNRVVEQPATQPPAIPTDKPNLTETQVAPSEVATQATPIRPGPGASTMADVGAESAAQSAGIRTAEFVNEAAKTPDIPVKGPEPVVEADLQSVDPKVEQRWQDAKIAKQTILQKGLAAIGRARDAMTRHFRWLDPKTDGVEIDILRRHENVPVFSKYLASQVLRGVTATLSPRKYDVFSRIVILRDLAKYAEKYGEQLEELPFGYPSLDAIKTDLARFEQTAQKFPDIAQAVQRRDAFMDALRYDLVSRGLLPEQVKDFGEYFHHQVLEHMAMKESGPVASTGAYDVRTHKKGWQRKRTGSEKDYNTSYLESEFEVISQAFSQMLTQDTLKELRGSDILPDLKAEAKAQGADWQSLIPKDYTIWQPQKGNHFYWANSIADKALESYFRGERSLTEKDVKEILAMGGPKEQWVIPKRLAKTLNDWGPQVDHPIEKFIGAGQSQWKRWTLFNPMRNLIYELNNFSGDADIAFAVDPKIFKFAPEAAKVLREFVLKKKAGTQEINELIKLGVIDSGFSVQELPDLKGNQFFKALEGKDPSIVSKYWNTVLDFNRWREGILRYAAYQRALQKLQAGEKPYWTSKRTEMDALYSDPRVTQQQIAAKLAREAIGDYGNISVAGQWIRSKMIPFYAWMEINAPRYVRLFQNLPYEGEGRGRLAGVAAKKVAVGGAKLAARAGALYILANIWNKTFFPQEEKELADTRDQFHIILGRNEDGSVRSLRFQGALSDALSWFGGEDVIGDVEAVKRGTATVGEKLTEAAKSPVNKLLNASFPIQKTLTEALFQKTTFPDVFNPRLVRDPGAHLARLVSMGTIYNYLTSKPQRTGTWSPLSLVTYTTDPGEAAYYTAKSLVSKYLEDQQKERPGSEPTRRGNALYYYKQAVKYKDEKTAEYWKQKYFELGGKPAGMQTSIRNSNPFYGVKRNPFMETLTPSEQAIMLRAEQWYKRTYLNH